MSIFSNFDHQVEKVMKLKDYKGDFICAVSKNNVVRFLEVTEIELIKEYQQEGFDLYGAKLEKIFDEDFIKNYLKIPFKSYLENNEYLVRDKEIIFDWNAWKRVEQAVRDFFSSLGNINYIYRCNKNIIIEVDE